MENKIYTTTGNKNGINYLIYRDSFGKEGVVELNSFDDYFTAIIKLVNDEFKDYDLKIYILTKYIRKNNINPDCLQSKNKEFNEFINENNIKLLRYSDEDIKIRDSLVNILRATNILNKDTKGLSVNNIYNLNSAPSKIIDIYIRAVCDYKTTRNGSYAVLMVYNYNEKIIKEDFENTHQSKLLLLGLIKAITLLKEPTFIRLHTHTYLGFKSEGANMDLKEVLFNSIKNGNHSLCEIVEDKKQDELQIILNSY